MKNMQIMFQHIYWANHRILEVLQQQDNEEARRLFSHILCAEQVWLTRLSGKDSAQLPIWKVMSLNECERYVEKNEKELSAFVSELEDPSQLERIVTYKNSKGTEFKTSVVDILIHIALHGQYHRGQINRQLRQDNIEPINVDFISFVR